MGYRLHYFPESGNSDELALMLRLCRLSWEPVWTDFGAGVTRTREWRSMVNEMGEIPVLEDDSERLTQTGAILTRLAERHGRFGPVNDEERWELLRWLLWDNHKLSSYMATYRFMRCFIGGSDPAVLEFLRRRADASLAVAESRLRERDFVLGDRATIADLSMAGYLSFPADESGYDLASTYPAVASWLGRPPRELPLRSLIAEHRSIAICKI
jgi:glutathione S-transferase